VQIFKTTHRKARAVTVIAALAAAGIAIPVSHAAAAHTVARTGAHTVAYAASSRAAKPSIVLVHGAWADSSSWNGVVSRLQHDGYKVLVPPNPLEGLTYDSATIRDFLHSISGPIILVGHSYGGAVITNAATGNRNVKALVYVDAFAPAKGESALGLDSSKPGSALGAGPAKVFNFVPFPGAKKGDAELYVKRSVFEQAFANGLPAREGAVLAATQSPAVYSALTAPSGTPAWNTIPSWYVLGTIDKAIPPAVQLFMAQRIHAHITRVRAGHLSMVAAPGVVAKVITAAAKATS
jgi:pimeloyl-ACP methyl ester carboxylesterase